MSNIKEKADQIIREEIKESAAEKTIFRDLFREPNAFARHIASKHDLGYELTKSRVLYWRRKIDPDKLGSYWERNGSFTARVQVRPNVLVVMAVEFHDEEKDRVWPEDEIFGGFTTEERKDNASFYQSVRDKLWGLK